MSGLKMIYISEVMSLRKEEGKNQKYLTQDLRDCSVDLLHAKFTAHSSVGISFVVLK